MTSNMLTGERSKWASARRGGMTVLGKVAVPKPINLPSQRLENHGLDPNVEIVPKGTLSWGSRSSSSASNAWGSSTQSPNTDGGNNSPSHLSGRPSSGGSGTRPSTAGSERAHEPVSDAWGQKSRPSSASGVLSSNQTPITSLRPRSADTRPGSSHLSRFAESSPESSVAWGAVGTAEKLGVGSSKSAGFSLSNGDFPTLGSEKDNAGRNTQSQDHGRPSSSSGGASGKERTGISPVGDASMNDNVSTWKRDNLPYVEDGTQPYPSPNMLPPQHFDYWHGPPPVNNAPAGGVWYRGPPPPYGAPVGPGGFPIEPFPYYRPQIHNPKGGDLYMPHMPDGYIRPGMPIRPGFYPGPVAYEGYYGPPAVGYNERDIPFMGMAGPPPYNGYPGPNPLGGNVSGGKSSIPEQVAEPSHPHGNNQGPYKVLLKQHNHWDGNDEGNHQMKVELMDKRVVEEQSTSPVFHNAQTVNESSVKKMESAASDTPRDSTLIQKIEGLNVKARASGEQKRRPEVVNAIPNYHADDNEPSHGSGILTAVPHDMVMVDSREGKMVEAIPLSGTVTSRRATHHIGRVDQHGKRRFNAQVVDAMQRKPPLEDSSNELLAKSSEITSSILGQTIQTSIEASDKFASNLSGKNDEELSVLDQSDSEAQRAKRKELAKQRAIQLQREEEERTREQKAKALAKLEELNRRTQAVEGFTQKSENVPQPGLDISCKVEESQSKDDTSVHAGKIGEPSSGLLIPTSDSQAEKSVHVDDKAPTRVHDSNISKEKQMGFKQKQNTLSDKSINEKSTFTSADEAPKSRTSLSKNVSIVSTEAVSNEIASTNDSGLPPQNISTESLTPQRKKTNRSIKNKPKETTNVVKGSGEIELNINSVESPKDSQYSIPISSIPSEKQDNDIKALNNQGKSHLRRKNPQANRLAEKFHSNEAVVWTPVRSQNRTDEATEEASPKTVLESSTTPLAKNDQVQKSKRAEMERYVAKPVAKEMAQQGSVQQLVVSPPTDHTIPESTQLESKQNKHGKSWRQRGSLESTRFQDASSSSPSSIMRKSVQDYPENQQIVKNTEVNEVKGVDKANNFDDGWNTSDISAATAPVTAPVVKDQGLLGRGKRQPWKGHKGASYSYDFEAEKNVVQKKYPQASVVETTQSQTEKAIAIKERGSSSHWQPKSQAHLVHNQKGGGANEGQNGPKPHGKEASEGIDQSVKEMTNIRHKEANRERKAVSVKGRPDSPQGPGNQFETIPPISGFRKNGSQNSRFGRVHETPREDNRQRQRHNSQYEYQPIGPYDNKQNNNSEGPTEGPSHNGGARYRERGQSHSRRGGGNFYGRNAAVRVDAGYD